MVPAGLLRDTRVLKVAQCIIVANNRAWRFRGTQVRLLGWRAMGERNIVRTAAA
jgi:hypothetical protein